MNNSDLDRKRPIPGDGDIVCDGCWGIGRVADVCDWVQYKFKHLNDQMLCPQCQLEFGADFLAKQELGL